MDGNVCVEIEIEDITRTAERKSERFYRKLPYFGVLDLPAMAVDEFFHPSPFCDSKLGMKTYVGERAICFALKVAWNQFAQMKSDFFSDKGDGLLGQKGEMMDFMRTATGTITKRFAAVMKSPDEMEEALYNPELKKTIEKATKAVATNEDVGLDDESAQLHIQEESELEGSSTEEENEAEQEGGLHDPDFLDNVIDAEQNEGERLRIMSDAGPTLPKTSRLRAIPLMWVEDGAGNDVLPLDYDLNIRDILIDSQLVDYLLTIRLKPQPVDYADYFVHEAAPVSAITGGNDPKFFTETKVLSDSSLLPRSKGIEPSNDQVNVAWDLKLEGAKEVRVYEATKGFNKEVYRSEAKGKSLEETGW
ncbi:unnamed protein product, partial [Symbiodinium sp. KB8]